MSEVQAGRHEREGSTTLLYCLKQEGDQNSALVRTRMYSMSTVHTYYYVLLLLLLLHTMTYYEPLAGESRHMNP